MTTPGTPSTARLVAGVVIFLAAIGVALFGFLLLTGALNTKGHGSAEVRHALIWLGAAGGGLGTGVCLLIWEFSIRLNIKTRESGN